MWLEYSIAMSLFRKALVDAKEPRGQPPAAISSVECMRIGSREQKQRFEYEENSTASFIELASQRAPQPDAWMCDLRNVCGEGLPYIRKRRQNKIMWEPINGTNIYGL